MKNSHRRIKLMAYASEALIGSKTERKMLSTIHFWAEMPLPSGVYATRNADIIRAKRPVKTNNARAFAPKIMNGFAQLRKPFMSISQ